MPRLPVRLAACGAADLPSEGKTVPTSVAAHPRVFATLTTPVHNQPDIGRCHCGHTHPDNDRLLGSRVKRFPLLALGLPRRLHA